MIIANIYLNENNHVARVLEGGRVETINQQLVGRIAPDGSVYRAFSDGTERRIGKADGESLYEWLYEIEDVKRGIIRSDGTVHLGSLGRVGRVETTNQSYAGAILLFALPHSTKNLNRTEHGGKARPESEQTRNNAHVQQELQAIRTEMKSFRDKEKPSIIGGALSAGLFCGLICAGVMLVNGDVAMAIPAFFVFFVLVFVMTIIGGIIVKAWRG